MEYLGFRGLVFEDTTSAYVDGVARITLWERAYDSPLSKKWISMQDANTVLN